MPIVDHGDDMATARIAHAAARQNPERVLVCPYPEDADVHNRPIGLNRAIRMLDDLEVPYVPLLARQQVLARTGL